MSEATERTIDNKRSQAKLLKINSEGSSSLPDTSKSKKQFNLTDNIYQCESSGVEESTPKGKNTNV